MDFIEFTTNFIKTNITYVSNSMYKCFKNSCKVICLPVSTQQQHVLPTVMPPWAWVWTRLIRHHSQVAQAAALRNYSVGSSLQGVCRTAQCACSWRSHRNRRCCGMNALTLEANRNEPQQCSIRKVRMYNDLILQTDASATNLVILLYLQQHKPWWGGSLYSVPSSQYQSSAPLLAEAWTCRTVEQCNQHRL